MSEYTEIFGRRIKDLTTPNSDLNKTSELVGNIKIPAGNFPTELSGCEGLRLIDLKNYLYTPVDPEIYDDIELIKLDLDQTKISLNLKISEEEKRAELEESKLDTKINVAYGDLNSKVSEMETNLEAQIASVGVGNKAYKTYALMDADKANIPAKSKVTVTNDETASNNGDWQWDGIAFTKSAYDLLQQAKNFIFQESQDLFKQQNPLNLQSNMTVRRYSTADTSNDYAAGTYQTQVGQSVQLDVVASGSNATKHFYLTSLVPQNFEAKFKVTLQNFGGDAVGVGFKTGNNFEIIAFSNSGNFYRISNHTLTTLQSGLGGYVLGDTVKFKYDGAKISVYVNEVKIGEATLAAGDAVCFGQMGFSRYLVQLNGQAIDPIREYVAQELSKIPTPDPTILPQAKTYTETYVEDQSIDLFKKTVAIPYSNNMSVTRFTAVGVSNDYAAGTYQSLAGDKVNLTAPSGGSNAIKHYFVSAINAQDLSVEIKVTKQNFSGDSVGIGFKDGANFNLVAFSNSGNLSTISGFTNTLVTSGLGGYGVGDTVKFDLSGSTVNVYVNGAFKAQQTLSSTAGVLIIGQLGFSQYESSISGASTDPIREYVQSQIETVSAETYKKGYYSFDVGVAPLMGMFKVFTQVKDDMYVGFEIKHEYDMREEIYQDYWRIYQALFYKLEDGVMQPTGKTALGIGESEFVLKTNSTKVDFTGGYHGDELVTDIKFLADGLPVSIIANISLTACNQFEYIEKSTMHETADANGVIAGHPEIADHIKHTVFKDAGYKTRNLCAWNYDGLMTIIYHGISCIHKDVATTVFSDDTYTDQAMTGSTNNYFNAIGSRLYKARNEANGLAVEATAYQVTPSDKDALSEFFVHDRSTDSKYYRKTPAGNVAVGEKHESYFECKFLAV